MDALAADYPDLALHGVVGDFTTHLDRLPRRRAGGMVAFLGGTIGNLLPAERAAFLAQLRSVLQPGEQLLLGTGLVTDEPCSCAAYDDAAGVTAEFNRNVLHVLNRELDADFDVDAFAHVALWDPAARVDRDAAARQRAMTVHVARLGPDRRVRGGGGDAHGDLGEVPPRRGPRRCCRPPVSRHPRLDRPRRPVRPDPRHCGGGRRGGVIRHAAQVAA